MKISQIFIDLKPYFFQNIIHNADLHMTKGLSKQSYFILYHLNSK